MKYLITGAAGFIGSALTESLLNSGHDVIGVDNFNDYYDPQLKYARIRHRNQKVVQLDVANITTEMISEWKVDVVVHLAARAGVRASISQPELYHRDNIDSTQNLIRVCEVAGIQKVLYASTSCLMANNKIIPWVESEPIGHVLNPYAYTKFVNECQFRISKIPTTIGMRFFTVYGPWGRPDMALFSFTSDILNNKPIDLYNFGNMKRDFTFIDDIIDGIRLLTDNQIVGHDIFNIGNGKQVGLLEFVDAIQQYTGVNAITNLIPMHKADAQETWSDTTKIRSLGYHPKTDIQQGVESFVQWYITHFCNKD